VSEQDLPVAPPDAAAAALPNVPPPKPAPRRRQVVAVVAVIGLVLGFASLLIALNHTLQDAVIGAAGAAVAGGAVARRIVDGDDHRLIVAVLAVVLAFAGVLLGFGYELKDAIVGAGVAGLVAGEVAAWILNTRPRRTP
jgi:hypothetical protein